MRFVIYDDETMEPITVISLRGVGDRDIERLNRQLLVPIPPAEAFDISDVREIPQPSLNHVVLRFEQFFRHNQSHWMCFTDAPALAMLLHPDWLPGQRSAVQALEDQNSRLTDFISRALTGR